MICRKNQKFQIVSVTHNTNITILFNSKEIIYYKKKRNNSQIHDVQEALGIQQYVTMLLMSPKEQFLYWIWETQVQQDY